jgi:hypothetical protein
MVPADPSPITNGPASTVHSATAQSEGAAHDIATRERMGYSQGRTQAYGRLGHGPGRRSKIFLEKLVSESVSTVLPGRELGNLGLA